ncbi:MAG: phenylacetate-CoA oxygenase subunit PaaC [Phycisphaerales bacterium]|nr:phenylacetate-CoA oxygenase subunit PaaC [Phycisphaerales bacterium]
MTDLADAHKKPLVQLLFSIADDKLVLGHRNADWTGLGPILEEDIAFSALAQDDIAHAGAIYGLIADITGGDADHLAYGRTANTYRCCDLVELNDEFDWAVAVVRQFFCDHFEHLRLRRLSRSNWTKLRQLASRMLAEENLAIGHADQWIVRLAKSTSEARGRIQHAVTKLAPLTPSLFEPTEGMADLEAAGVYPPLEAPMFDAWESMIANVIDETGLRAEFRAPAKDYVGGRHGKHSADFAAMLSEMTEVYREEPAAQW